MLLVILYSSVLSLVAKGPNLQKTLTVIVGFTEVKLSAWLI